MVRISHADMSRMQTRVAFEETPEFQIAPMIDILLVLLIFFVSISSTEVLQRNESIRLPVAMNAATARPNDGQVVVNLLWVAANNSGSIKLGDETYANGEQLGTALRDSVRNNPRTRILIRADKEVRYEFLKTVIVAARDAGVGNVTFSVVTNQDQP